MPKEIEQNDVDISTLFKWSMKYTIVDLNDNPIKDVYLRVIGDADLNRSRVFGLRKSSELRKKLSDSNSDEYLAYIPDIDLIDINVLIETVLIFWAREYAQTAVRELKLNLPVEPGSDASLEEQEKYQEEIDNWPTMRENKIREFVEGKLDTKRKELQELPKETLYKEYLKMLVNRLCEDEMLSAYRNMCAYHSLYEDSKFTKKLFNSFEEFNNISTELKNQLVGAYISLEIDGEDLKKLLGATQ
jgi:hypothetical protein